jgi:hypothetical protein
MKLKMDDQGHVVAEEGKPVYVYDDGREAPVDAGALVGTITRLGGETKAYREARDALEEKLKAFSGIEDPDAARKALDMIKNLDEGKLVAAGKVEEIKSAAAKAAQEQVAAQSKAHTEEINRLRSEYEKLTHQYHGEKIGTAFAGSKFISDKSAIPADLVQARFGSAFKVEDGRLIGYDRHGNKIFSRVHPGEVAAFDEALEMLVDDYPYRDNILKGNNNGGGGTRAAGGGATNADLMKLPPTERINAARARKL